ncbi:MAG: hypothetical protein HYY84_11320 [Deltaproteobacteria bacterium]|nr:hypothetical protein [Deltaproteobacteria bacterium]
MKKQVISVIGLSLFLSASQASAAPFDSLIKMVFDTGSSIAKSESQHAKAKICSTAQKAKKAADKAMADYKAARAELEKAAKHGKELKAKKADAKLIEKSAKTAKDLVSKVNKAAVEVVRAQVVLGAEIVKCK